MNHFVFISLSVMPFLTASCSTNTGIGLFAGGTIGAGAGGLIGGGGGALIGTAVGLLAGGLIGAALDEQDRKVMSHSSPRTVDRMDRGEPLTLNDVIKLSQGGVSDEAIISYLTDTRSTYNLSQTQIRRLQDSGVSQRVINFMATTGQ
jgi:outer membrane lipoprotein SlyB